MDTLKIDIVSDIVCPWCVIGFQNLKAAMDELQSELNLQSLQVWSNFPGIDHETCMRSIKLFNDEVIPKINLDSSNLERAS